MERAFKGVWIPKEIWLSKDLSLQEKVFLVEIDSLDNENGCFASNSYFADFFDISNARVSQVVNGLKKKGYIDVEFERDGKQITKRIIKIKRPPYPYLESLTGVKNTKEGIKNPKGGIKKTKEGYLENYKDNNTSINNTDNNILYTLVVDYLNQICGTAYRSTSRKTQTLIRARQNEGFVLDDFKTVINKKYADWKDTSMEKYLRPETLFGTKFEGYLNEISKASEKTADALNNWFTNYGEQ